MYCSRSKRRREARSMRGGLAWWERPRPRTDRGQRRRLVSLNRRTTQLAGRRPVRADAAGKAPTVLTKRGVLRRAGTQCSRDRYPTPKDFVFAADVPSGRRQATGPPTRVPSTAWQPERRRGLVRPGDSAPEVGDRQTATRGRKAPVELRTPSVFQAER